MTHLPAETTTQPADSELGITQLLWLIKRYSDIDFDASQMHLTDAEAHAIAKLLIQQLTASLNGKLIAGTLNTLRHSEEMEEFTEQSGRVLQPGWVQQFVFVPKPAPTHLIRMALRVCSKRFSASGTLRAYYEPSLSQPSYSPLPSLGEGLGVRAGDR
jgi:hypothetical protein